MWGRRHLTSEQRKRRHSKSSDIQNIAHLFPLLPEATTCMEAETGGSDTTGWTGCMCTALIDNSQISTQTGSNPRSMGNRLWGDSSL